MRSAQCKAFESLDQRPGEVRVAASQSDGVVEIRIEDDGVGIPEDTVSRIFDPFFSTRRMSGGTGLGLSISHGIITEHGGTISVSSEVGKGTQFTIDLPPSKPPSEAC